MPIMRKMNLINVHFWTYLAPPYDLDKLVNYYIKELRDSKASTECNFEVGEN